MSNHVGRPSNDFGIIIGSCLNIARHHTFEIEAEYEPALETCGAIVSNIHLNRTAFEKDL
ncbi:MAG: hypothetical protein DMG11_26565 [Acidobacteria bacterium]|nr:MAG: hypothetical protein DMG11_26565 [Acidobacteriota bacterium]